MGDGCRGLHAPRIVLLALWWGMGPRTWKVLGEDGSWPQIAVTRHPPSSSNTKLKEFGPHWHGSFLFYPCLAQSHLCPSLLMAAHPGLALLSTVSSEVTCRPAGHPEACPVFSPSLVPHLQFLQETLAVVSDNTWTCQLSLEMCKQLPCYNGTPQEKVQRKGQQGVVAWSSGSRLLNHESASFCLGLSPVTLVALVETGKIGL